MKTIGGVIYPDKSFAYPLYFKFKADKEAVYKKVEDLDIQLDVRNENNSRESLSLLVLTEKWRL